MTKPSLQYSSYLLRIWRAAEGEPLEWRACLVDLATGKRVGFANQECLLAFLETISATPTMDTDALQRKEDADVDIETDE